MGERTPHLDPNCRGVFFGLSAMHTRGDMIRSVMEGVCFGLRDSLTVLDEMGISVNRMRICGGGGKSVLWRGMLADVYGLPLEQIRSDEGPALGAAILAMVGVGLYPSVQAACDAVVQVRDVTKPEVSHTACYDSIYHLYRTLYQHLKEDFTALAMLPD